MKNFTRIFAMLLCVVVLATGCGIGDSAAFNLNTNQTTVVLQDNNFEVVRNVKAESTATYILGIGGLSKSSLRENVISMLTKEANLKGAQALTNVTVNYHYETYVGVYSKVTCTAEGTVVQFK